MPEGLSGMKCGVRGCREGTGEGLAWPAGKEKNGRKVSEIED